MYLPYSLSLIGSSVANDREHLLREQVIVYTYLD